MGDMSAEAVLEIAKDSGKLKDKLKQLADAEKAVIESGEKVKARNKELNAEYDAKRAELEALRGKAKSEVENIYQSANAAMVPVQKAQGELSKREKAFANQAATLDRDRAQFAQKAAAFADKEAAFLERVEAFEAAVASLVKAAK
jgi:DNA repair exonuclease SbcCD ATPase subunit